MKLKQLAALSALTVVGIQPAFAVILYDQNVTPEVIFGSGNANGSFTVDQANGVELGLRAKLRHNPAGAPENTFNSNGSGGYNFIAGSAFGQSASTAVWSFEWSINSNYTGSSGFALDDLSYELGIDTDPGAGISYGALVGAIPNPIDPVNVPCADHALGNNSTGNGGGASASCPADAATYVANIGALNVAQNSWKPHWFIDGFDPAVDGQYDFYLAAFDGNGNRLARTEMSVIVGRGAIPEPAALALFGLGLAGFAASKRSR